MAERQPSKLHVAGSNPVSRSTRIHEQSTALRRAIAQTIRSTDRVAAAADALSVAYRSRDSEAVAPVRDIASAEAYVAARMPATYSAVARALEAAADRHPGFVPRSLLDVGSGSGAAAWASRALWPSIDSAVVMDREATMLDLGRRLASASGDAVLGRATSRRGRATDMLEPADLVTAGYLLGELPAGERLKAVDRLWAATRGLLVIVEPGSRAGFERVLAARSRLIDAGAHIVAPCPGREPCPVAGSATAWCHFLARLDRSPVHRRAKSGSRSWEDEPFSYVAVAREPADPTPRIVLGRPRRHPGRLELRVCIDGRIETRTVSRREGEVWRLARDLEWGDAVPPSILQPAPPDPVAEE